MNIAILGQIVVYCSTLIPFMTGIELKQQTVF